MSRNQRAEDRHKFYSKCGKYIYHISIIDYLTDFNFSKKFEHFFKVYVKRKDKLNISAVNPKRYSERFINFINREVIINEKANIVLNNISIKEQQYQKMHKQF